MHRLVALGLMLAACTHEHAKSSVTIETPDASAQAHASGTLPATLLAPANIAWQWEGDEPGFGHSFYKTPRSIAEGDVTCTFTYDHATSNARTACTRAGRELWHVDEAHAFVEDAALVLHHGTLYIARFSNIATGCILHAYDALAGMQKWMNRLVGIGPIGHSEYLNAVQLRMIAGRPVVFGWESGGRYIEAVDPTTGKDAFHMVVQHE